MNRGSPQKVKLLHHDQGLAISPASREQGIERANARIDALFAAEALAA